MEHFRQCRHCPRCGAPSTDATEPRNPFHCGRCQFTLYFNPAVSASAWIVRPDGNCLLIRRAREPAKGKLALPGGFIDMGETAEAALRRELREEVGVEVGPLEFLGTSPNSYLYREVVYPVLDLFFVTSVGPGQQAHALEDVAEVCWLPPAAIPPEELAFSSMRVSRELYLARTSGRS